MEKMIFKNFGFKLIFSLILGSIIFLSDFYDTETKTEEAISLKPPYIETTKEILIFHEEQQEMVWVSHSGEKYHNNPDCSNMKNPDKISKADAINRGRTPCSKCY